MINKKVFIPIYDMNIHILVGTGKEISIKLLKVYDVDCNVEGFIANVLLDDKKLFILFNIDNKENFTYGVIAHEALHAVHLVYKKLNINHNEYKYESEQDCLLLEWIVNKLHKIIKIS